VRDRAVASRLFDGALAVVIGALGVAEIWVPFTSVEGDGSRHVTTVLVLVISLALTFRRRSPLGTAVFVLFSWPIVSTVTPLLVLFWGQLVPMVVAVFTVARYGRGREPWYGALAAVGTLLFFDLRVRVLQQPSEIIFHWTVFVLAWSVGYGLRRMERRAKESMQRAIEAEVGSAERTATAIADERARIARELHDVVAHAISVMIVQAGAAEQVIDDDPDTARRALETIRSTGTGALAEMRRMVTMLRDNDQVGDLAPQPGVAALPTLLADARASGLDVDLDIQGNSRSLPAGVDLATYRIVQEALTNVRRHAAASHVEVRLRYGDDNVEVEVSDDGRGASDLTTTSGHGLIGMRERAALYGGRVETASRNGAGFTVMATLPLAPE
jgi:signal transduction histidine kinase